MLVFGIISAVLAGIFCLWIFASLVGGMIAADFEHVRWALMTFCIGAFWLLTAIFLCLCA